MIAVKVEAWHQVNGCHLHADDSVAEGVCCICEMEAPCDTAEDEAAEWAA